MMEFKNEICVVEQDFAAHPQAHTRQTTSPRRKAFESESEAAESRERAFNRVAAAKQSPAHIALQQTLQLQTTGLLTATHAILPQPAVDLATARGGRLVQ